MEILASDLMGLPIEHSAITYDSNKPYMMFETIDKDNEGDTARWRLVFSLETGQVYSHNEDTRRTFSYWSV